MRVRLRTLAVAVAVLVAAGCGQKPGVGDQEGAAGSAFMAPAIRTAPEQLDSSTPASGTLAAGTSSSTRPPERAGTRGSSSAPASGPATAPVRSAPDEPASGGSQRAPATGGAGATPAEAAAPSAAPAPVAPAGDRSGGSEREVVIGHHGPVTGAAPVPQDSLEKAKGLYWKYVAEQGGIHGRNVRVVFYDDQFNPSHALQVGRQMVEQDHVFRMVDIGTDQVAACARYAA